MKITKLVAILGIAAMSAALLYGFLVGNFFADGALIIANPWGIVSLVDLYTGFSIFSLWIFYKENNKLMALFWIAGTMILGFFLVAIYLLIKVIESKGSVEALLLNRTKKIST